MPRIRVQRVPRFTSSLTICNEPEPRSMALSWGVFGLAIAGWLAVTAVVWQVLYTETKRQLGGIEPRRPERRHGDDADEAGDSPA